MTLEAGTRLGKYSIVRLVAQGGMAEVYRADQALADDIKRPVALKVIRPEYSESKDFRQMFLDEARTACTLSHQNIVHIYEVGESDDGQLYMAMELVTGETLATINRTLREHSDRFSLEAIFSIGISTCRALEAVHALKVEGGSVNLVHRDVSPHNLLLSSSGTLKLIDFGIAKAATNHNLTMPGVTKGKAGYFSPEQALGKKLDGRSDLFSVGVTLYKLLTGNTPFDDHKTHLERNTALVKGEWKRLREVMPELPESLLSIIDKSMAVSPDERFQTAEEMREALEAAAFDAGLRTGPSTLTGYVDNDGEITATAKRAQSGQVRAISGSSKQRALQPPPAPVPPPLEIPPTQVTTDKVHRKAKPPPPPAGPPYLLMALAFLIAVALGGLVIFFATSGSPERPQPGDVKVVVDTEPPHPNPQVITPPPPPVTPTTVEEADAGLPSTDLSDAGAVAVVPALPTPPPNQVTPTVRPKPPPPPSNPGRTTVVVKPPTVTPLDSNVTVERTFEPGTAKLRIVPSIADSIESISVDGAPTDNPFNIVLPAGWHQLTIKLNTGKTVSQKCGVQKGVQIVNLDVSSGRLSGC